MSEHVVVRCPSCSQKYRVTPSAFGHRARCKKCQTVFVVKAEGPVDDDAIISWITDDDPSSRSVMGSTGIFQPAPSASAAGDRGGNGGSTAGQARSAVKLIKVDDAGAHFEFSSAALLGEELRNSMPHKCAGCGSTQELDTHSVYWPERSAPPFTLPFPVYICPYCDVTREVRAAVRTSGGKDVCSLTIASLAIAVDFFRKNGGRHSPEYHRLIEKRDFHRDPWRELDPPIRQRIAKWFVQQADERFVRLFHDSDFAMQEIGSAGVVLTTRRLVFKKYAAFRAYPLDQTGRIEIIRSGERATVHIYESSGQRPAVLHLDQSIADELATDLQQLHCRWTIVS